jgi:hypothetical protein
MPRPNQWAIFARSKTMKGLCSFLLDLEDWIACGIDGYSELKDLFIDIFGREPVGK